ncbi:aldehyde dehydrogenase [Limnochorda pilosa]|uniref:Aldehyde dehydrogenase n=1 Tax=Limnochorda pilosa TaxID=1555112 RepID=A0A0K2SGP1_LIMPI|nr:aldehyde dehydrogenase [Limnochorda pilosa]
MEMFIGGRWTSSGEQVDVRSPYDGRVVGRVPLAGSSDVERAIASAVRGTAVMRDLPAHERSAILKRTGERLMERLDAIADLLSREVGKTIREARAEVQRSAGLFSWAAEEAKRLSGETIPFDAAPGAEDRIGFFLRVPVGVVAAITPFNVPLALAAHKLAPALAAGNSVLFKPTTATPLADLELVRALVDAGLPPDAINAVTGRGSTVGDAIVSAPQVRMITFTGSREVGRSLTSRAGFKKLTMELGGNAPCVVRPSADVSRAAGAIVRGGYAIAGQNCISVQRVLAHSAVYAPLIDEVADRVKKLRSGDPLDEATDMGPVINGAEAERIEEWIQEAVGKGARLVTGGHREGTLVEPTVLADVPLDCRVSTEELFGPVVAFYRVDDLEEIVRIANGVDYGLQSGIFTQDVDEAFWLARRLDAGGVWINDVSTFRVDFMPYGGMKGSGYGREGVRFAMEEMTEIKVIAWRLRAPQM